MIGQRFASVSSSVTAMGPPSMAGCVRVPIVTACSPGLDRSTRRRRMFVRHPVGILLPLGALRCHHHRRAVWRVRSNVSHARREAPGRGAESTGQCSSAAEGNRRVYDTFPIRHTIADSESDRERREKYTCPAKGLSVGRDRCARELAAGTGSTIAKRFRPGLRSRSAFLRRY